MRLASKTKYKRFIRAQSINLIFCVFGTVDCVKLLLENGADPRTEDNEGTTAFDLAKNDEIRRILHEALIEKDAKDEVSGQLILKMY